MIKLLLVDDELHLLEITKGFLEESKEIEVETSLSAKGAIEKIRTTMFDVIVSDYQMPEMNGIELLKLIRAQNDPTPFILFTGKGREEVVIDALNAGADFYLQKGGDPRAQFTELVNMVRKAVQRRRMEFDLIQNELKFKTIFNSANDSIYILDPNGRIIEINDIGCSWLGYSRQEMMQKRVIDLDSEQYAMQMPNRMKEVMESGFALFETEWVTKGGKRIPIEVSSRKINYAGKPAILSVARDVSERKMSEEILIENEIKFRTIANFTYDWEYWIAPDGNILFCSPSCEKISGYSSDELSHDPNLLLEMVHPEDRALFKKHYEKGKKTESFEADFRIITKKNDICWISHACQPVFDDEGRYLGRRVSNRDITERKRAEDALLESVQRYELIMDGSSAGLWDWDVPNKRAHFSSQWKMMRGYTNTEIGDSETEWISRLHPDEAPRIMAAVQRHFMGQTEAFEEEYRIRRKDGSFIWVFDRGKAIRDSAGKVIRMAGSEIDIDERKRAEEALRESENRFREVFNNMDSGIAVYGAISEGNDFIIKDFNSWAEKIEGVRKESVIGKRLKEGCPGAEAMGMVEVLRSVWKTGGRAHLMKSEYIGPNRASSWRENLVFKLPNGEIVAIYSDVTERKMIEDEWRLKRYLFDESIAATCMSDENGIITQVNKAFLQYLGYSTKEEVIGRPLGDFMIDRNEMESIVKHLELKGKWQGDYQARRKDGSMVVVHGLIIALKDENGKPIGYHSTAIDITDHKSSEETSSPTNVKLNILSNITVHDIQNQVVVLNGLVYKAKHANSPVQVKEYLSRIQQVADKIQSHIAFAREYQNLGKAPPSWMRVDAGIQDLASKFDSKWVQFELNLGSLEIFSDAMLNRAFYNLIDDTLKHGQKATKVRFSAKLQGEDLVLVYEDNGVGVPMDRKKNIFEKASSGQKVHGLVLVKEILGITGMTIKENGEPGKGARFEIVVPKGNFRYPGNDQPKLN